jgi:hypothetical protein
LVSSRWSLSISAWAFALASALFESRLAVKLDICLWMLFTCINPEIYTINYILGYEKLKEKEKEPFGGAIDSSHLFGKSSWEQ